MIQSYHNHSTSTHKVFVKLFVQFGRAYHGAWIICRNAKRVMYHAPRPSSHQEAPKKLKKNRPYTQSKDNHIFRALVVSNPAYFPGETAVFRLLYDGACRSSNTLQEPFLSYIDTKKITGFFRVDIREQL
jgi:hypothetical protein